MNELGLSISYDRLLQLENQLANSVCAHANALGLVCPSTLRCSLFTASALDNLDHNPSSTTATDAFHGTGISLFQSCTESNVGQLQSFELSSSSEIKDRHLPESYTVVPAVALKKESVSVPKGCNSIASRSVDGQLEGAKSQEISWLQHAEKLLERFVVIMYSRTSSLESVDEARMELFCQNSRTMENLPPTRAALYQHSLRSIYQASIWTTSELSQQNRPSPTSWGWSWDDSTKAWTPVWTTLQVANQACLELVKCNCRSSKGCGGRCGCRKANFNCTELCKCHCAK